MPTSHVRTRKLRGRLEAMNAPSDANALQLLAELRTAYKRSLSAGAAMWKQLISEVKSGTRPAAVVAELSLCALESMGSDDPTSLGMDACNALRRFGGSVHLERLRALRPHLPTRRGLRDWRTDADFALAMMEARADGQCTCSVVAARGGSGAGEQWAVERESVDRARYCSIREVRCTGCGSRWRVTRDDSYHYPVFTWTKQR